MNLPNRFNTSLSELRGIFLVVLGIAALIFYYSWWFQAGRLTSPWLILGFVAAIFYGIFQLLASWLLYLWTHRRPQFTPPPPEDLTIDVFVTAWGESVEMVEQCLAASCAMRVPHKTWLLDDGQDPALAELAERLGVGYLTRESRKDAKAGNVNAALTRTEGDIIAIFDVDHVPTPDFLQHSVGGFTDPAVGFVQVMPTFSNHTQGWVAKAATETTFDFYNPTSIGMDGLHSVTKMGTNSIIRRAALNSIGGYQPGLAEDLATSIALHAAGWRSRYVAEPLAPGLAPPDLTAWFTQQFKWARGVFEILLTTYPRLFGRLRGGQRLSYAVRTTNYLLGPVICVHIVLSSIALFAGTEKILTNLQQYFIHITPLAMMEMTMRYLALRKWRHVSVPRDPQWRAPMLVFVTWPIYTLAWLMAILRLPLSFRPTPKKQADGLSPLWIAPQLLSVLTLTIGLIYSLLTVEAYRSFFLLYFFTICLITPQLGLIRPLSRPIWGWRIKRESSMPPTKISVSSAQLRSSDLGRKNNHHFQITKLD